MNKHLNRIRILVEGTSESQLGTGVYNSPKQPGFWKTVQRGMNTFKSLSNIYKQGAPVLPVKGRPYEDDSGNTFQFGEIVTGMSNADPYYFEFEHKDDINNLVYILYGQAHASRSNNAYSKPIVLRIKDILPGKDTANQSIEESRRLKKNKLRKARDSKYAKKRARTSKSTSRMTLQQFMNHPEIKSLISRYNEMKNISTGNKKGDVFGILTRKVPGDDTSIWKLVKHIKRVKTPKTTLSADYIKLFDKLISKYIYVNPGQSVVGVIGTGPIELAATESGLSNINSVKDTVKALLDYTKK